MLLAPLIRDLAVILGVAALVTLVFQRIRQPVVLGYILAGFIVGPRSLSLVSDLPSIRTWADLGVIFLMFSLGLDFSFRKLAKVGISASLTAIIEISAMLGIGYGVAKLLGWRPTDRIFLGAMLAISSTTIIIKALDELKLRTRRFAEMIFGVLVVEDLVAVLILVALSTFAASSGFSEMALLVAAAQLVLVISSWFLVGYFVLPRFVRYVGRIGSDEMLTILALGLCLCLAVIAALFDYSVALGAFIMGSILAESTESQRIDELMKPIRDMFAAIFFVSVGMLLDPGAIGHNAVPIAVITLVYVIGKIVSTTFGAVLTGQTLRTAIQVGFGIAQIGEFSFIIATLGQTLRVTSEFLFPVAVSVSLITTFMTPYLIRISHKLAVKFEASLPFRIREGLSRWTALSQERRADTHQRAEFYRQMARWVLSGLTTTVVFIVIADWGLPRVERWLPRLSRAELAVLGWGIAVFFSAPFLWSMLSVFTHFRGEKEPDRRSVPVGAEVFLVRLLTGLWIGLLSLKFFAARHALLLTFAFAAVLFLIFYRRLESSYRWFEQNFLSAFEAAPKTRRSTDVLKHLAPWDAHLVRIKVHPNADVVGKKIMEAGLRKRHGLNIVAIQRGLKTIVAPKSGELIFPKDELLVLGTDEQIEPVRFAIEKPPGLEDRYRHISGYELKRILLTEASLFSGKSIRDSGIGSRYGAMVVGLERGDHRTINPDSDSQLQVGDILWVVGETDSLRRLEEEIT